MSTRLNAGGGAAAASSGVAPKQPRASSSLPTLATYFFTILLGFSVVTVILHSNSLHTANTIGKNKDGKLSITASALVDSLDSYLADSVNRTQIAAGGMTDSEPVPIQHEQPPPKKLSSALAGLSCDAFGGPFESEAAQEMVYWQDILADSFHMSPFLVEDRKNKAETKYVTFEPDSGGWNNIRMGLETAIGFAFAMGRTLVLPPEKSLYLLSKGKKGAEQRTTFTFAHFFHTEDIHNEHSGLDIISTEEFLNREAMKGQIKDPTTQKPVFPPGNRTQWDGSSSDIFLWLRENSRFTHFDKSKCLAVFPATTSESDMLKLRNLKENLSKGPYPRYQDYVGHPVPVNGTAFERLKENLVGRHELCYYEKDLQDAKIIHFPGGHLKNHPVTTRLLVHFYAFLFFQDWNHDLWLKRFIRDHIRYADEIQCAAARVVQAVRKYARSRDPIGNPQGLFDTLHVRRGDFQYKDTRVDADKIYEQTSKVLSENSTVYIATDERDKSFFNCLKQHYDVVFLDDFMKELTEDVNTNYYGMVDALIASRGRNFFGCWFSTFTGYINRLRGYHADKNKSPGYEQGIIASWYYAHADKFDQMSQYYPLRPATWTREFPTSWRLINTGMEEFHRREGYHMQM